MSFDKFTKFLANIPHRVDMNDNVGPKIDPFGVKYKNLVLYSRDMFNVSSFQLDLTFVTVNYRLLYIFKYSCHAWHFPTCIFDLFFFMFTALFIIDEYTEFFKYTHTKKCGGFKLGDPGSYTTRPPPSIHLSPKHRRFGLNVISNQLKSVLEPHYKTTRTISPDTAIITTRTCDFFR